MKRISFLLFFIAQLLTGGAFAQETGVSTTNPATDGALDTSAQATVESMPNVGEGARAVDSIQFAPSPFPKVSVTMKGDDNESPRPFVGRPMQYERSYGSNYDEAEQNTGLTRPIDFAAEQLKQIEKQQNKETVATSAGKIIEIKKKVEEKTDENVKSEQLKETKPQQSNKKAKIAKMDEVPPYMKKRPSSPQVAMDASKLNIANLTLGMTPDDAIDMAADSGFEITNVAYGIPSFMVTDFERACRSSGLYQTRLIHECIRNTARENEVYYISQLVFANQERNEKIVVLFSSTLTGNKAFKIDYTGYGDNSLGTSYKDLLKKTHRRDVFWKYVTEKYGQAKTKDSVFWSDSKGTYLRAYLQGNAMDARIVLENTNQTSEDYTKADTEHKEQEKQEMENPFSF